MPNGGSDCCGSCWFNSKNKGEAGYGHADDPESDFCELRDLEIENSFYTYCANHPHRNPERLETPIGPVFVEAPDGGRSVWKPSADTEAIRLALLELVAAISELPAEEYPMGEYRDEIVVWQLGEFREARAVEDLRRIAAFGTNIVNRFRRSRASTVRYATEALAKVEGVT